MGDDPGVLAALDRELEADPVLACLRSRLSGTDAVRAAARTPRVLLTAGLVVQLLGCFLLSAPVVAVGVTLAMLAFYPAVRAAIARRGRGGRNRTGR